MEPFTEINTEGGERGEGRTSRMQYENHFRASHQKSNNLNGEKNFFN